MFTTHHSPDTILLLEDEADADVEAIHEAIGVSGVGGIKAAVVKGDRLRRRHRLEKVQDLVARANLYPLDGIPPDVDGSIELRGDRVVALGTLAFDEEVGPLVPGDFMNDVDVADGAALDTDGEAMAEVPIVPQADI